MTTKVGATDTAFNIRVARKYLAKQQNAAARGLEFSISLKSMENLMKAEHCFYTGFKLTEPKDSGTMRASDRTIDRIDSSKGYVKGNVVACCHAANHLKSMVEGGGLKGYQMGRKVFDKTIKRINKGA